MNPDIRALLTDIVRDHADGLDLIVRIEANRATMEKITGLFDAEANPGADPPARPDPMVGIMGVPMVIVDDIPDGEWKVVRGIGTAPLPDLAKVMAQINDMMPLAVQVPGLADYSAAEFLDLVDGGTARPVRETGITWDSVSGTTVWTSGGTLRGTWDLVVEPPVTSDQDLCPQCGNAWVGDRTPCGPIHAAVRASFEYRGGS